MYKAIYYWTYNYLSQIKSNDKPASNAIFIVTLLEEANLISFGRIIYNKTHFNSDADNLIIYAIVISLSLMGFNFVYLYRNRNIIFKNISAFSRFKLKLTKSIFWIYVCCSLIFLYAVIYLS